MLQWPIPALSATGLLFIAAGLAPDRGKDKKKKQNA
jgi:hypothetical protein